jgi:hypothetical protein
MAGPSLYVRAPDEGTRIEVLDPTLQPMVLPHNAGEAKINVTPGVYSVRFRRGLAVTEKLVIVSKGDNEIPVTLTADEEPVFATAAPIAQVGDTNPIHRRAAEKLSLSAPHPIGKSSRDDGRFLFFVRADGESATRLDAGITLHAMSGRHLVNLDYLAESNLKGRWAGVHLSLPAGVYRIRRRVGKIAFEQVVHIRKGWQTQYFAKVHTGGVGAAAEFTLLSLLMAHESQGFDGTRPDGRFAEAALRALRERSTISGPLTESMLHGKFENPLLGIMAALLQLRRKDLVVSELRPIVNNLLWLVGPSPDVLAIGLGMLTRDEALRDDAQFRQQICIPAVFGLPPYFSESWRHICDASQWDPSLTALDSLAARAAPSIMQGTPWFRWRVTQETEQQQPVAFAAVKAGSVGMLANIFLTASGFTPEKVDALTASMLSNVLQAIQTTLAKFGDVAEVMCSSEFSEIDRRIVAFVFPLTDAALEALLVSKNDRADALREAVLSRGRNGREMARALQLPLGTATFKAVGLATELTIAASRLRSEDKINEFVDRESQGNAAVRAALESLAETRVPLRRVGETEPLDGLDYFVTRYTAARTRSLKFLDPQTGKPSTKQTESRALEMLQRRLTSDLSKRIRTGESVVTVQEHEKLVAPLSKFESGKLFPAVSGEVERQQESNTDVEMES